VGVEVRVAVSPEDVLDDLPRPVDLAAFRVIQESLTNVSRHSGADGAEIRIREADGALLLEVLDEGPGVGADRGPLPDLPGGGNGIVGMRERAAAVGGYLRAGPRPGRGFAVLAVLPLEADAMLSAPVDLEQGWTMEQDVT
jgi:signal transduction histidine kinase